MLWPAPGPMSMPLSLKVHSSVSLASSPPWAFQLSFQSNQTPRNLAEAAGLTGIVPPPCLGKVQLVFPLFPPHVEVYQLVLPKGKGHPPSVRPLQAYIPSRFQLLDLTNNYKRCFVVDFWVG